MNGTTMIGGRVTGNPGPGWHVMGAGDYNKDGRSGILFQNSSGAVDIWEMNGTSVVASNNLGNPARPGASELICRPKARCYQPCRHERLRGQSRQC